MRCARPARAAQTSERLRLKVGAGDTALTTPQIEALAGAIPLATATPQPDAENLPGADPAWLDGAGTDTLALFDRGDDRRLCTNCLDLLDGVCRIAKPGGLVPGQ